MDPLIAYIYMEGLGRFATTPYAHPDETNYCEGRMHLTNFAVNKKAQSFAVAGDGDELVDLADNFPSKWKLQSLLKYIDAHREVFNNNFRLTISKDSTPGDGQVQDAIWDEIVSLL